MSHQCFFGCWCLLNVNQFLFVLQSSQCFRHVVFLQCLVCCFLNFAAIFPLVIHVLFLPFSMVFTRCSIIFHAFSSIFPWVFTPHSVASPPKIAAQVIPVTGQQGIRHEDQEAQGSLVPAMFVFLNYSYTAFWWFLPLWKILVNGKDYPIYYGKTKNVQNHQPDSYAISKLLLMAKLC